MELYDQIRKISFSFFMGLGILHFLAGLFYVNNFFLPLSGVMNRVLFIPFVLSAMTFGLSNFKYNLAQYGKDSKGWNYLFITLGIIVFVILLAIEFLVPDSRTPLLPPTT